MQQCNCCCVRCVESQMHTMPVCGPGLCVHERRRDKNSIQIHQPVSHVQKELLLLQPAVHFMTCRGWWWRGVASRTQEEWELFPLFTVFLCGRYKDWDKKRKCYKATAPSETNLKIQFLIRSHQSRRAK